MQQLKEFQSLLNARNEDNNDSDARIEKLLIFENAGLFHLEFYGVPFNQSFGDFLNLLSTAEVASKVRSLTFLSPDQGANGTRNWDFSPLLETEIEFPELTTLFIEPGDPTMHNHPIVAKWYDEEGMLGRFLLKSPKLESLTSPSAPDSTFFNVGKRPLYYMRIETGLDHQNFILNLSQTSNFPDLRVLDFGDYYHWYMEDPQSDSTPFEHYKQLLESKAFSGVNLFFLRNSNLTEEEIATLKTINEDSPIRLIDSYRIR